MTSVNDLEILYKELTETGVKALVLQGNVRNSDEVKSAVQKTLEVFESIDILFTNAGICAYRYAHELTEEAWDSMLDINLKGAWLVAHYYSTDD